MKIHTNTSPNNTNPTAPVAPTTTTANTVNKTTVNSKIINNIIYLVLLKIYSHKKTCIFRVNRKRRGLSLPFNNFDIQVCS